ncbi:MAG: 6-bladed beta-propeller [Salinivirgaceae bacterium]|nr:6-bladed beta-propeller [Salinivirgaceae bacterium]
MMKTNIITIAAICTAMMACNSNQTDTAVTNRVELPGTVDNEAFASNVESISVMNLQMDDDWVFASYPEIVFGDNSMYLLDQMQETLINLICFDRQTGEKVAGRSIKGRGPGEINQSNSLFCIGDTLYIQDIENNVKGYDKNIKYVGLLHEFEPKGIRHNMLRLDNGTYALVWLNRLETDSERAALILTDNAFDTISTHFSVPENNVYIMLAEGVPYYANVDTIRFIFPCDNHLYSLCGDTEQCTELVLPKPLTPEIIWNMVETTHSTAKMDEYDGFFGGLGESGRFVYFKYHIAKDYYISMFDKRTSKAVSIIQSINDDLSKSADIVNEIIKYMNVVVTDGKYIYARCENSIMAQFLEGHDDVLDARLKKTQAEYRAYLERNAEFIKGLEPEERDAATVLLKIKLKD